MMASSQGLRPGARPSELHSSRRRAKHEMRALPWRCAKHRQHPLFQVNDPSETLNRDTYFSSPNTTTTINTSSNTVSNNNNDSNTPINATFSRSRPDHNPNHNNNPSHLIIERETSHWPDIRAVVTAGFIQDGRAAKLQIACSICLDDILEFPTGCTHNPERRPLDAVVVLPCGHFFGRRCLGRWFSEKLGARQDPSCPNCRFRLVHRCGHVMQLPSAFTKWSLRTRAGDGSGPTPTMLSLPVRFEKLLSEGGQVGDKCAHCRAREIRAITARVARRWDIDITVACRDGSSRSQQEGRPELQRQQMRVLKQYLVNRRLVGVW